MLDKLFLSLWHINAAYKQKDALEIRVRLFCATLRRTNSVSSGRMRQRRITAKPTYLAAAGAAGAAGATGATGAP